MTLFCVVLLVNNITSTFYLIIAILGAKLRFLFGIAK